METGKEQGVPAGKPEEGGRRLIEAGGAGTALALALALALAGDEVLGRPRLCASALLQNKSSLLEAAGYPGAVPG